MNWRHRLPPHPLHWVCLASALAVTAAAAMSLVMHLRGDQGASEAWFLATAVSIAPGVAAMAIRIRRQENVPPRRATALLLVIFPALVAVYMGAGALDPDALHRWGRAAAAAVVAASLSPAVTVLFRRETG